MSRRQPDLAINGVLLPVPVAGRIDQTYRPIGGFARLRFADGAALHQESWRRLETTISASGWIPAALAGMDWAAPVTLGCVAPRALQSASPAFTLPTARRADAPPYGFAVVEHRLVPTTVTVADDEATLAAVTSASAYTVLYYPVLVVLTDGPRERYDASGAVSGFELTGEEI